MSDELTWWWLSFADPHLPEGSQFLGVAIVQASDFASAVLTAHALAINPGGEVRFCDIPADLLPPAEYRDRLLSRADAEALSATMDG